MQVIRHKVPVYQAVANVEERAQLKDGDTVHRPYRSDIVVKDYTKGTAITVTDITATDESLAINTTKVAPFYVDDVDALESKYDIVNKFADDAGRRLEEFIDGDFLGEVINADHTVDDGDIGGTAGTAITLSTSNVLAVFAAAGKKLNKANISMENRYAVISPTTHQLLLEYLAGKDTQMADKTGMNGMVGRFMGFDLYLSNNTYWTGRWTPADQPSDGDTLTIAGVTFTFETGTIDTAGMVKSETSTAVTIDNLVLALNAPATSVSAKYQAVSDANVAALEGISATDGTTYIAITFEGGGEVAVSGSEALDLWSVEIVHLMFGQKGAVDLVIQKEPTVVFKEVSDKLGKNVLPWTLYGIKTFDEGDAALVDVKLNSASW